MCVLSVPVLHATLTLHGKIIRTWSRVSQIHKKQSYIGKLSLTGNVNPLPVVVTLVQYANAA